MSTTDEQSTTDQQSATFQVEEKRLEFPRVSATVGNEGVNISSLLKETGLVTLDSGFMNTASCESAITYIDGEQGILRYRGYPIDQLAKESSFLEVAYLLIYGELPDSVTMEAVTRRITRHRLLHEDFKAFFTAFPANGHPMAVLQSGISALATYYQHTLDPKDNRQLELATVLLMAKVPTMIADIAKRASGLPMLYPDSSKSYIEDFIRMTFGLPYQHHDVDPTLVKALDMLLILHADHEQNCSTSTVRMVGSSNANIYASVAAGVGALSGPLHGGANEAVLEMLHSIQGADYTVDTFMEKVKNKEEGVRLMGFGHRVYKNYDP
ncbi:citrate/2-methylcitrate synthase, partial [Georgenia sp. 10Sc9-8]|nr:citrate/2-methylcitrate synthase [Georgenia halotolerans]